MKNHNGKLISFVKKYSLSLSILFAGVLISISIYFNAGIDFLQKIFSIIGSLSLVVALVTYLYKKKQDETLAAIGQITFFREKIIPEWDMVQKAIKSKRKEYWFSRIGIDKPAIVDVKQKFSRNFNDQLSVFFDSSKSDHSLWSDIEILDKQIILLNLLEEFSLTIYHFKVDQHLALNSVHAAFIEIIEKNAVAMLFVREVITANPIYSATLLLYDSWKNTVGKSNYVKNLERCGFITKNQRENILKEQRKNALNNGKVK